MIGIPLIDATHTMVAKVDIPLAIVRDAFSELEA